MASVYLEALNLTPAKNPGKTALYCQGRIDCIYCQMTEVPLWLLLMARKVTQWPVLNVRNGYYLAISKSKYFIKSRFDGYQDLNWG